MKNLTIISLLITAIGFVTPVYAGTGHSHDKDGGHSHGPISAATAKARATKTMLNLAKRGIIDKSWTSITATKAEKKTYSKGPEWVVSFVNEKIKDKAKQNLYIFYSLNGQYIAANYTGK